jgi:hypothetical protein
MYSVIRIKEGKWVKCKIVDPGHSCKPVTDVYKGAQNT